LDGVANLPLFINTPHRKFKHHALPHVKTGRLNKYGIVAFHVHLIGNAKSIPRPAIRHITPIDVTKATTIFSAAVVVLLIFLILKK
jgi:hypothetical protein